MPSTNVVLLAIAAAALATCALGLLFARERWRRRQAERAATEVNRQSRQLADTLEEAVVTFDLNQRPIFVNTGFERLTGYSLEALAALPPLGYVHADDRQDLLAEWNRLPAGEALREREYRVTTVDGADAWWSGSWTPLRDHVGRPIGYVATALDITERRRSEHALRRDAELLQTIVEIQQAIAEVALDSDAVAHVITERGRALTGADGAAIELLEGDRFRVRAWSGLELPGLRAHNSLSGVCVRTGAPQSSPDVATDPLVDRQACLRLGIRSILVVPLLHEDQVLGVFKVVSKATDAFTSEDRHTLGLLAGLMAATLTHAAAFEARQARLEHRTRALQESEQRFKQLVDAAQEGIWVLDDRGVGTYVNQRMANLLGYPSGEILGRRLYDFVIPSARAETRRAFEQGRETVERYDLRLRRKDGGELWTIASTSPILDRSGGFVGSVVMVTDFTDRKRAEDRLRSSTERLRTLHDIDQAVLAARSPVEVARAALARIRRLVPCHRCTIALFDFEREEGRIVAGFSGGLPVPEETLPLSAFSPGDLLRRGVIRYIEDIAALDRRPAIYEQLLADGIRSTLSVPLLVEGEAIGELNLGLSVAAGLEPEHRDIAVEIATPLAVAIQHARLRDEMEQRTALLERRLAADAAELRQVRSEFETFVGAVSHDLRTPLRHIHGFARILLEESGPRLDEVSRHYAERIAEGARGMATLMEALLQLSRVGRQDLLCRPTDLGALTDELLAQFQTEAAARRIEWRVEPLPVVNCDAGLVRLALSQVLSNAIKFTGPRPNPRIEITPLTADAQAGVTIRDNGVGFRVDNADRLFGVFERLHRSDEFEGIGVGLALAQRIVQRHGGRIWAESDVDNGATFHLTFGAAVDEPSRESV